MFKMQRKLIDKQESKVSILQLVGFLLMILSIGYLLINLFWFTVNPQDIAVNFFIIMLGFAFAFPSLLKGNDGLSTMRIVVFMMTNVICMLLLKIGWADNITSLSQIGLDQYWMGVIAFVFGAKATQSFFESKLAVAQSLPQAQKESNISDQSNLPIANTNIITEAIKVKGKEWVNSFPNVTGFSVGTKNTNGQQTNKAALIFKVTDKKDNLEFGSIPEFITYTAQDGNAYKIQTDVLQEGKTKAHNGGIKSDLQPFPLGNSISRRFDNATGSIGLVLKKDGDLNSDYIMSCYHVFCDPELKQNNSRSFQGTDDSAKLMCASSEDNGTNYVANVVFGCLQDDSDFAIAKVREGFLFDNQNSSFGINPIGFGFVFSENVGETLKLCGRTSGTNTGVIKNYHASQTIYYCSDTRTQYIDGFIELEKCCDLEIQAVLY